MPGREQVRIEFWLFRKGVSYVAFWRESELAFAVLGYCLGAVYYLSCIVSSSFSLSGAMCPDKEQAL